MAPPTAGSGERIRYTRGRIAYFFGTDICPTIPVSTGLPKKDFLKMLEDTNGDIGDRVADAAITFLGIHLHVKGADRLRGG